MASSSRKLTGSIRKSCDRCHSFKLRCQRLADEERCERCIKQDALCHYSPKEPRRQTKRIGSTAAGNEAGAERPEASASTPISTSNLFFYPSEQSASLARPVLAAQAKYLETSYHCRQGMLRHASFCYSSGRGPLLPLPES
jgi:hypothetical protein